MKHRYSYYHFTVFTGTIFDRRSNEMVKNVRRGVCGFTRVIRTLFLLLKFSDATFNALSAANKISFTLIALGWRATRLRGRYLKACANKTTTMSLIRHQQALPGTCLFVFLVFWVKQLIKLPPALNPMIKLHINSGLPLIFIKNKVNSMTRGLFAFVLSVRLLKNTLRRSLRCGHAGRSCFWARNEAKEEEFDRIKLWHSDVQPGLKKRWNWPLFEDILTFCMSLHSEVTQAAERDRCSSMLG